MIQTRRSTRKAVSPTVAPTSSGRVKKAKPTPVSCSVAMVMMKSVSINVLDLSKVIDFSTQDSFGKTYSASEIELKVLELTNRPSIEIMSDQSSSPLSTQHDIRFEIEDLSLSSFSPSPSSSSSSSASLTSSEVYELVCCSEDQVDQQAPVQPDARAQDCLTELGSLLTENLIYDIAN